MQKKKKGLKILLIIVAVLVIAVVAALIIGQIDFRGPLAPPPEPTGTLTMPEGHIINVHELRQAIVEEDDRLIIIGVINPTQELIPQSVASRAIEGAYLVWRPDYSAGGSDAAISPNITGMRRSVAEMEELLSRAGATAESKIVVYAADAMHDAARFVWQLRMLGHDNVWYLDGGMNAWLDANFPFGNAVRLSDQPIRSQFRAPNYNPAAFDVSLAQVVEALENPNQWVVIDTRAGDEFAGERTGSSAGAFGTGRIAGTPHINWNRAVDPDTQLLRSRAEIEEIYGDVIQGKNVILFCQSGVRSAHTWLVLTEILGAQNVFNYEGSWIEWSYAASNFSDYPGERILELTEEWTDNNGAI